MELVKLLLFFVAGIIFLLDAIGLRLPKIGFVALGLCLLSFAFLIANFGGVTIR